MKKALVMTFLLMFAYLPLLSAQETQPPAEPQPEAEWKSEAKESRKNKRDYTVQINLNYWFSEYTGELTFSDVDVLGDKATIKGEKIDLVDELGLENEQAIPEVELRWRPGEKHMVLLSWYGVNYGGEKELDTDIEFAGYTFDTGTEFETDYRIDRIKLVHQYTPVMSDMASLDLIWGAEYYTLAVGYEGTSIGQTVDGDEFLPVPIPIIGIGGNLYLPYGFGAYAQFSGMGIAYEDMEASYTDLDVGITYDYKYLHAGVGYRMLTTKFDVEEDDEEFDLDVVNQGVLATVGVSF